MELDTDEVLRLLGRVAERDEPAFRRLYEAVSRRVYAFALHRLHDSSAAGEIVNETLYQVWRLSAAYRGDAKFSTWVLGIARHKILDRLRSATTVESEDIDEQQDLVDDNAIDAFDALAQKERRAGVVECLGKLADAQRECLHLVFYEGMTVLEVSRVQGVPANTVKTRLFHARANVKKCLQRLLARERGDDRA